MLISVDIKHGHTIVANKKKFEENGWAVSHILVRLITLRGHVLNLQCGVWCFTFVTVIQTKSLFSYKFKRQSLCRIIGSFYVLAWLAHITQIQACSGMVNMYISICGCQVTRHTYITFVSTSVLWEVCVTASTGLAQSLCVFWFCSRPTYMLWSSFDVQTPQRPRWAQAMLLSSFAPFPFSIISLFLFSLLMLMLYSGGSSCCLFINFF